jgi:hypothetical protein
LDKLRELCPDLADEVQKETEKKDVCKKCKDDPDKVKILSASISAKIISDKLEFLSSFLLGSLRPFPDF